MDTPAVEVVEVTANSDGGSGSGSAERPRLLGGVRQAVGARVGADSVLPIYAGLGLALLGFVLIAYTWARVAGTLAIQVQLPYIVSGGLTGLSLVIAGATVLNMAVRRREAARREERLEALATVLDAIARAWGDDGDDVYGDEVDEVGEVGEP